MCFTKPQKLKFLLAREVEGISKLQRRKNKGENLEKYGR